MTVSLVKDPGRNHEGRFQPDEGRPPIIAVDGGYNLDKSCRATSISFPLPAPRPRPLPSSDNLNLIVLSSAENAEGDEKSDDGSRKLLRIIGAITALGFHKIKF